MQEMTIRGKMPRVFFIKQQVAEIRAGRLYDVLAV